MQPSSNFRWGLHFCVFWPISVYRPEHVEGKFDRYLMARKQLPDYYADTSIGFRLTRPKQGPRFMEAVEARFQEVREKCPDMHIQTRWF